MNTNDRIYLDNAATTAIHPEVLRTIEPYLSTHFGNPSAIYGYGRYTRLGIENARKTVARHLACAPSEIFFTSGATESINSILQGAVLDLHCKRIITSPIEHHATLHAAEYLQKHFGIILDFLNVDTEGQIHLHELEEKLKNSEQKTLVSLLHINNEIGTITDIDAVADLCEKYNALFHLDAVQTMGHRILHLDTKQGIHFLSASGHKFHAPKGVGFMYVQGGRNFTPLIKGGAQERNMRGGTENVSAIVGLAKALELAYQELAKDTEYIFGLKQYLYEQLKSNFHNICINGMQDITKSLYSILNVGFPKTEKSNLLTIHLDMRGVCVSSGSACSSGAENLSHVIAALGANTCTSLRFSFSKFNTKNEVDCVIRILQQIL